MDIIKAEIARKRKLLEERKLVVSKNAHFHKKLNFSLINLILGR